jgi:branched-chain amino acid transport system ATP-binding protein
VFAVSDTVVVLDRGQILARGTPEEIAVDERVIGAYLGRRHAERQQQRADPGDTPC